MFSKGERVRFKDIGGNEHDGTVMRDCPTGSYVVIRRDDGVAANADGSWHSDAARVWYINPANPFPNAPPPPMPVLGSPCAPPPLPVWAKYQPGERITFKVQQDKLIHCGVIDSLYSDTMYLVARDDGKTFRVDGLWIVQEPDIVALVSTYYDVGVAAEKKGYVPDGFDEEAHRAFMRTLGG